MTDKKELCEIEVAKTKLINGLEQERTYIRVSGNTESKCLKQFDKVKKELK